MNKFSDEVIAASVALVVGLATLFIFDLGWLFSAMLMVGSYFGTVFLLPNKAPSEMEKEESFKDSLAEGASKFYTIRSMIGKIQKQTMAKKVADVCVSIQKILEAIKEDPSKLKAADQFLGYYLDSTIKILQMYISLTEKNIYDSEIQNSLIKVESTFTTLKEAFEKQLAKLLSNDAMNLDAELHLLEQTINMEGLGK